MRSRSFLLAVAVVILCAAGSLAEDKPRFPGPGERGFLLPNGWTITPAGEQVVLTDLPLNIMPLADNRHALVATSGYNAHELSLIDLEKGQSRQHATVQQSWFGLAVNAGARQALVVGRRRRRAARVGPARRQSCRAPMPATRPRPWIATTPSKKQLSQRPVARRQTQLALLARHRRRQR